MTIRSLTAADAEIFRHFRLQALGESPLAFGVTEDREAALSAEEWVKRLSPDRGVVHGSFDSSGTLVGTLGVYVLENEGESSGPWLWTMYVIPAARRQGIARRLMRRMLEELRTRGETRTLRLHVTDTSVAATALYESVGFEVTKQEFDVPWHKGQTVNRAEMGLPSAT